MSEFHVHVDAVTLSKDFENHLTSELGFWRSDFSGHPEGVEHFEPPHHLTKKVGTSSEFRTIFDGLVNYANQNSPMTGYLEGEYIALDKDLEVGEFNPEVRPPFKIRNGTLPAGAFRESEIHVVMDRDRSDPRLLQYLSDMGLFTAYMPKSYGRAQIFTAQGSRASINHLLPELTDFLDRIGGAVNCSVKEERVVGWWLSHREVRLPPVVESIERITP